jgi:hypothetical protein
MPVISGPKAPPRQDYRLASTRNLSSKRSDDVRQVLRLSHFSMHAERASVEWMVRFIRFHGMRSRQGLFPAEPTIESFLTTLSVHRQVTTAIQNQAMNTLVASTRASSTTLWRAVSMPYTPTSRSMSPCSVSRQSRHGHLPAGRNPPHWWPNVSTGAACAHHRAALG